MDEIQKNEILFQSLVMMFETAAMQHMGKLKDPITGSVTRDLQQAQFAIDILDMLKEKTRHNVTDPEMRHLDSVIASLKLTYVDEIGKGPSGPEEGSPDPHDQPGPSTP